mgnify:CR=1 FL=1
MPLHTAVIPAAGMGTRFLPATKAVPKELMPIFDTPALQLVMDEAIGAGCDHIVVVSGFRFTRNETLQTQLRGQ